MPALRVPGAGRFFATVKRAQGNGGGNGIVLLSGDRHVGGFYHAEQGVAMETGTVDMAYGVWEVTSSSFTHTHVDPAPCQTQWSVPAHPAAWPIPLVTLAS